MSNEVITLRISEEDVEQAGDPRLARIVTGRTPLSTLGGGEIEAAQELMNLMPEIIAKKIQNIIPKDFVISEISMGVKIAGRFLVCGIDGDVNVKMKPKEP